jgi:hypothetical protein
MFGGTVTVTNEGAVSGGKYLPNGPYLAYVTPQFSASTLVDVICDDDADSEGSSWTANTFTLQDMINGESSLTYITESRFGAAFYDAALPLVSGSTALAKQQAATTVATEIYEAVGYLALQLLSPANYGSSAIQQAIWSLTGTLGDSTADIASDLAVLGLGSGSQWGSSTEEGIAFANASKVPFSGVEILAPTGWSCTGSTNTNGTVSENCGWATGATKTQEFIISTAPEPATYALFGLGLILLSLGTFRRSRKNH